MYNNIKIRRLQAERKKLQAFDRLLKRVWTTANDLSVFEAVSKFPIEG